MPSVGHVAVGLAAARFKRAPHGLSHAAWASVLVVLSLLPDLDIVAFTLGIAYGAPFGHRGAIHSLTFALLVGIVIWIAARALKLPPLAVAVTGCLVVASHGILDTLTDGGKGIALFWPFSNERYFAPWRPIPVAPIGARLFSSAGIRLMAHEALLFSPVFLMAAWRRPRPSRPANLPRGKYER